MAIDQQAAIANIAARALGAPAPAAPEVQDAPGQPPAPQMPAPEAPERDTPTDKATEAAAPKDATAAMDAEAVLYEIEMGEGRKRKLTPKQIAATFDRYSALNYKHAQMKPILDIVENLLENNPGATPQQIADYMLSLARAQQPNPTMGNTSGKPQETGNTQKEAEVDPFAEWEKQNASTLPPGYREIATGNQKLAQELSQMRELLGRVLASTQGVADVARAGQRDARQQQVNAIRQSIANNIDRVQAALQLPDDQAENFMVFAAERGYALEDFVDPRLTYAVMSDFKNSLNSGEFQRLADINRRRQAWTGTMGSAPAAPAGASPEPEGSGNGALFDQLVNSTMNKRFGG